CVLAIAKRIEMLSPGQLQLLVQIRIFDCPNQHSAAVNAVSSQLTHQLHELQYTLLVVPANSSNSQQNKLIIMPCGNYFPD
ncbi:MAG TPA: hypothetical protein DCQ94_06290, partial [Nitrospira sp.]|nr:hypothetical protein [Nitrospira sp.]